MIEEWLLLFKIYHSVLLSISICKYIAVISTSLIACKADHFCKEQSCAAQRKGNHDFDFNTQQDLPSVTSVGSGSGRVVLLIVFLVLFFV